MAITRTAKGVVNSKSSGTTLSISSVAMTTGDLLVVALAYDDVALTSVTWGSETLTLGDTVLGAGVRTRIAYGNIVSGGTQTITATWGSAIVAKAMTATSFHPSVAGQVAFPDTNATNTGTGTTVSTSAVAAIVGGTNSILFGALGTEGPSGDTAGTWNTPTTAGQRTGTTGNPAGSNVTISDAYQLAPTAAGTPSLSKTGITSRDWGAVLRAFYWAIPVQSVTLDLLDASGALYAPTLSQPAGEAQGLTLGLLDASPALYAPTLAAKNTITLGLLDASPALFAPTVIIDQFVTLGLLDASNALYAPTFVATSTVSLPLLGGADYASTVLAKFPVGLWRLGESSGSAADSSGNGHTLTANGSITYGEPGALTGDSDTAMTVNGSDQWLQAAYGAWLDFSDVFSLEAWIKRDASPNSFEEIIYINQGPALELRFGVAYIRGADGSGLGGLRHASIDLTGDTDWHHIVATKNGSSVFIYIDGVDVSVFDDDFTMPNGSTAFSLGSGVDNYDYRYKGSLDEVAFYDYALSPAEVAENYAAGTVGGSAAVLYAPSLAFGTPTIAVSLLDASPALYAPTLSQSGGVVQDLTLSLLDASPALFAPALLATNTITVGLLDGAPALFAPTLMPDQFVVLGLLDAGPALYAPVVNQGQSIVLGLLDAAPALFAPTLIQDQFVTLGLLDAGPALYAPVLYQDQFVTLALLDAGPALFAPTITKRSYIALGFLDANAALFAPTLTGGPSVVVLTLLDAGRELYAPIVSQPITAVAGDVLRLGDEMTRRYPWMYRGLRPRG